MSQRTRLAELDADLHEAFADAGLADEGTYTAPGVGAVPVPCRVYVDKASQLAGDYAATYGPRTVITLLRADVPAPAEGGIVNVDGETFALRSRIEADDGITSWVAE